MESEGFINALSSQAAKMKEKKRKISKVYYTVCVIILEHLTEVMHASKKYLAIVSITQFLATFLQNFHSTS